MKRTIINLFFLAMVSANAFGYSFDFNNEMYNISTSGKVYVHYADGDGEYVNIRKLPTSNSAIIGQMTAAFDAVLLETKGNWYRVDWGGTIGWVSANHCVLRNNNSNSRGSNNSRGNFYSIARSRYLVYSDISGYSKYELRLLRNEIYARHGYIFKNSDLMTHFSQFSWYNPRYSDVSNMLSKIETYNVNFIKRYE